MERVQVGDRVFEIDLEVTREYYRKARKIGETCPCSGCQNFIKATETFPHTILQFFDTLGIDPKKAVGCIR